MKKYSIVRLKKDSIAVDGIVFRKGEVFHLHRSISGTEHLAEIPIGVTYSFGCTNEEINEIFEDCEYKILRLKKDVTVYPLGMDYPVQLQEDKEFYVYKSLKHNSNDEHYRAFAVDCSKQVISDNISKFRNTTNMKYATDYINIVPLFFVFNDDVKNIFKENTKIVENKTENYNINNLFGTFANTEYKEENMSSKQEKIGKVIVNKDFRTCKKDTIFTVYKNTENNTFILLSLIIMDRFTLSKNDFLKLFEKGYISFYHDEVQKDYLKELITNENAYTEFECANIFKSPLEWVKLLSHPRWDTSVVYRRKEKKKEPVSNIASLMSGLLSGKVFVNNSLQYIKLCNTNDVVNVYSDKDCTKIMQHNSPLKQFIPENWYLVK